MLLNDILLIIFIIATYVVIIRPEYILIFFAPLNYIIDLLVFSLPAGDLQALLRGTFLLTFIFLMIVKYKVPILNIISFFFVYLVLLIPESSNIRLTISEFSKLFITLNLFNISKQYFTLNPQNKSKFFQSNTIVLTITLVNVIISEIYNLGWSGYTKGAFYTGGLKLNLWYIIGISVLISIHHYKNHFTFNKIVLIVLNILILLLSFRRSAIIAFLLSLTIYFLFFDLKFKKAFFKYALLIVFFMLLLYPVYADVFEKQLTGRQRTFDYGLENEGRILETEMIWSETLSFTDIKYSLLGRELFNTEGNYGPYDMFGQRRIHVDINQVVFGSGLIGLFIYLIIFVYIFNHHHKIINKSDKALFFGLFTVLVVTSFASGLLALTFKGYLYIALGLLVTKIKLPHKNDQKNIDVHTFKFSTKKKNFNL